jgi:molybdenum cofactor biosynthesis enzyme MoaA
MSHQESTPASPSVVDATRPALDWIVLKVTQRCNLNCDYCYVYNRGDDSWRGRPAFISDAVVA